MNNINNTNAKLSKAFGNVLFNLYDRKNNKKDYSPEEFKELIGKMNILFKGKEANDSKDLILFLYENIHQELNQRNNYIPETYLPFGLQKFRKDYYSQNSSIIQEIFYNEQVTFNCCENCNNTIINYGIQNMLIFPLEKTRLNLIKKYPTGFMCVNLEDCFEEISNPDYMTGENQIFCNNCRLLANSKYITKINTCPKIMTIILNRGKGNEFDVNFDFPLSINIKNYVYLQGQNTEYDLISVLVHIGESGMSGHFFSYCKSNIDGCWYKYNDSIVNKCDENNYEYEIKKNGLPYVLFYERRDISNRNNEVITLYFKSIDGKEVYLDVNINKPFFNVIQDLVMKYNNRDYMNSKYFVGSSDGKKIIDWNKTVAQNNLLNYSNIMVIN
jgi:ubiquitin C-terminal hydrolase